MKRLAASLVLIIAMQSYQSTIPATPAQKAPHAPADLNPLLQPILEKYDLPAVAGAIVTSTGVIGAGAVGVRKYRSKISVTIDDQFHLGSDTKAMTAVILAMLVEKKQLGWTTTLASALPELAPKMDSAYRNVTLEQLLSHRAGFTAETAPRGKSLLDLHRLPASPREQRWAYAEMILREPPEASPGTKYIYSNRSYAIAGVIAEKIANKPWEDLMREWLFNPLGMNSCGFGAMGTPGKINEPLQHILKFGTHIPVEPGPLADNPAAIAPAAAVHCSVLDWAKFIQANLRGEKGLSGILKPETFKKLHTPPYGDYAFGWLVLDRTWAGGRAFAHAGSNTQNYANAWFAPQKDFGELVMINQGGDAAAKASDDAASALIKYALPKP